MKDNNKILNSNELEKYFELYGASLRHTKRARPNAEEQALEKAYENIADMSKKYDVNDDKTSFLKRIYENFYSIQSGYGWVKNELKSISKLPSEQTGTNIFTCAAALISNTGGTLSEDIISAFLSGISKSYPISEREMQAVPAALEWALIVKISDMLRSGADTDEAYAQLFDAVHFIDKQDVSKIVVKCSAVERLLMRDPAGVYGKMDDDTKAAYRFEIARLAEKSGKSEAEQAELLLKSAAENNRHIGHEIFKRGEKHDKSQLYISLLIVITVFTDIIVGLISGSILTAAVVFIPVSSFVKYILDTVFLKLIPPKRLMSMKFDGGIPKAGKTLCCISLLLTDKKEISEVIKKLNEVSITNRDAGENVYYGVLADLKEADTAFSKNDAELIRYTADKIKELNSENDRFFLFTRRRVLSESSGRYMARERKRGAVEALVSYLSGEKCDIFCFTGKRDKLKNTNFILILDSDTRPSAGSIKSMVSAALHPLNIPVIDSGTKTVKYGYGIITPKIEIDIESASKSAFSSLFAGVGGADVYSSTSSDVYQDIFGNAAFCGKGLINVAAYRKCLSGAFPENSVLSHDLPEGAYLRTGYLSDTHVYDSFPYRVGSYFTRLERWTRGDWQNTIWFRHRIQNSRKVLYDNPLCEADKWKILENLRRSLDAPTAFLCIFLGAILPNLFPFALITALISEAAEVIASSYTQIMLRRGQRGIKYRSTVTYGLGAAVLRYLFKLLLLPYEAYVTARAIIIALYRQNISRRNMLSWVTMSQSMNKSQDTLYTNCVKMWFAALSAAVIFLLGRSPLSYIIASFWLISPLFAYQMSKARDDSEIVSEQSRDFLLGEAEKIWRYFDENLTHEVNFLPPDNIQISPPLGTAYRTSPTNIGLSLLSAVSASDLGLCSEERALDLIEKTITTVEKMEKWHGHLYNWYEIRSLRILEPRYISTVDSGNLKGALIALSSYLCEKGMTQLNDRVKSLAENMDFSPLYDKNTELFYIGYDANTNAPSENHYDLMASEARQTSYISVADGTVPKRHWQSLSRAIVNCGGYKGMVSWTGTMFEYLMPHLLLPIYKNSFLYETAKTCVHTQIKAAGALPWGASESCYGDFNETMNYMYEAHGAAALALKRDMDKKFVISPYSSYLALMVERRSAEQNLKDLYSFDLAGKYGLYEAIDFTVREDTVPVKTYMSHHLGMSIVAICNVLKGNIMRRRFMENAEMGAYSELLEEKLPINEVELKQYGRTVPPRPTRQLKGDSMTELKKLSFIDPMVFPLTNGSYSVLCSEGGQSKSIWNGNIMSRTARDKYDGGGIGFIVRCGDEIYNMQPALSERAVGYSVSYDGRQHVVTYESDEIKISVKTCVFDDIIGEKRVVEIENKTDTDKTYTVYSYFEPAMARERDFNSHPAFSKMQLEFKKTNNGVIAARRSDDGKPVMVMCYKCSLGAEYSTSSLDIYARRDPYKYTPSSDAAAFYPASPEGCIMAKVTGNAEKNGKLTAAFALSAGFEETGVCAAADEILKKGESPAYILSNFETVSDEKEILSDISYIMGKAIYGQLPKCDFDSQSTITKNDLWKHSISGDNPIIAADGGAQLAERLVFFRRIMKMCGVCTDLVIYCENRDEIRTAVKENPVFGEGIKEHGVYIMTDRNDFDKVLFFAKAYFSGGGFDTDGREYIKPRIALQKSDAVTKTPEYKYESDGAVTFEIDGALPKVPWSHVMANRFFGTIVTETGCGFMWSVNSHENKINPWYNDKFSYENSEKTDIVFGGERRSIFAADDGYPCRVSYGFGWAKWEKDFGKFTLDTTVYVSKDKKVKCVMINGSNVPSDAKIVYYTDLLMADRADDAGYVATDYHNGIIKARNLANSAYNAMPFTFAVSGNMTGFTTKRDSFVKGEYDGFCGSGADMCIAAEIDFGGRLTLSMGCDTETAVSAFLESDYARSNLDETREHWNKIVSPVKVRLGSESLENYIGGWGLYQTVCCRLYARTSIYQNGGAFGFRDQLQDTMNIGLSDTGFLYEQIIRCCNHQFEEGDVQHWWHPTVGNTEGTTPGVRTLCSDDYLWIPYALCRYIEMTDDMSILDIDVPYIEASLLREGDTVKYEVPFMRGKTGTVFEHAVKCCDLLVRRGFGENGLCKILCGDWNDGLDLAGAGGSGESVWLTWFASIVMNKMADLCGKIGKSIQEKEYRFISELLRKNAEGAFSGGWFYRGTYDSGIPFGKNGDRECEIDSVSQSFSVFAGADERKSKAAVFNAYNRLLPENEDIVLLFAPPFDKGFGKPGYIKRYAPGLRENGGQYTHGALWLSKALFETGEPNHGYEIIKRVMARDKDKYLAEPYVVSADVYSAEGSVGRGGWTWYTGSAGWLYSLVCETMLGIKLKGGKLCIEPNLPADINEYEAVYTHNGKSYDISVARTSDGYNISVNGDKYDADGYTVLNPKTADRHS